MQGNPIRLWQVSQQKLFVPEDIGMTYSKYWKTTMTTTTNTHTKNKKNTVNHEQYTQWNSFRNNRGIKSFPNKKAKGICYY